MPAPSPVQGSQPGAPRWVRFAEDLEDLRHGIVCRGSIEARDEAEPAGIVLEGGIVEALARWQPHETRHDTVRHDAAR